MKQKQFEHLYKKDWIEFRKLLRKFKDKKELSGDFSFKYRRICNQLSLARSRNYTYQLVEQLEHLALEGHKSLYGTHSFSTMAFIKYIFEDYPALIRKEWRLFLVNIACFIVPALVMMIAVMEHPHLAYMVAGEDTLNQMEMMYDPDTAFKGNRATQSDVQMWGHYIMNNISIDFRCFAGGIIFGIGALFFIVFNGVYLGVIAGHINNLGYHDTFYTFVSGHAPFELTAMLLSGVAGLRLGMGLISPGRLTRLESLMNSAKTGSRILCGAAIMTFLAAFIEAYWSSRGDIPGDVKYYVGAMFWFITFVYLFLSGRRFGSR